MALLKLAKDDPQKELEFEVKCALTENPEERLRRWLAWNIDMLTWFYKLHGHQTTPQIVKRK